MIQRGFTLLELLITLAILSILLLIGGPNLSRLVRESRIEASTEALYTAIQLARTAAVSRNQRVTLRNLGSWNSGWEAFTDTNDDGLRDADELLLFSSGPQELIDIIPNAPVTDYISFIGTGESRRVGSAQGSFQAGTIRICANDHSSGYSLILARSGRVRTEKLSADDCI